MTSHANKIELIIREPNTVEREVSLPTHDWLWANFTSKSAVIRYLYLELGIPLTIIARYLNLKYRHVYRVSKDADKAALNPHTCPVCRNRGN